ncbi:MAG TPA: acyl-CoA dehydratase activase [Syntrophales bacterium]|nr:acyl-CoA dehydratase activase [Syntrophales bacterium]HPX11681.1 acyl-CoA dehydratase activase [Syntrophales bacterium]HQN77182.1 acyl-CoA dehydratase activase [Syntrophales bacterium]HQQ25951.1 acyl-CoA dehydratase activase [Syntrophales bacterium]
MIVAGCDIGSLTAKAVIFKDGEMLSSHLMKVRSRPDEAAVEVMNEALSKANLTLKDVVYSVGTGYGRKRIPFADETFSEIVCHGKGAHWVLPSVRTVIDVGGQDAKAIRLDAGGNVVKYEYNDKCASGTGRFLEIMADALEIELEEMGDLSLKSDAPVRISSQCVVFAETEVISLVNGGKEIRDVVSGLHKAMAGRIASLVRGIGMLEKEVMMAGGVAKNKGIRSAMEDVLGVELAAVKCDPQLNGAIGAALLAGEAAGKKQPAG